MGDKVGHRRSHRGKRSCHAFIGFLCVQWGGGRAFRIRVLTSPRSLRIADDEHSALRAARSAQQCTDTDHASLCRSA